MLTVREARLTFPVAPPWREGPFFVAAMGANRFRPNGYGMAFETAQETGASHGLQAMLRP